MACYNPSLVNVFYDKNQDKRFCLFNDNVSANTPLFQERIGKEEYTKFDKKTKLFLHGVLEKVSFVPCGSCLGCALDHSKNWAMRMYLESLYSTCTYFFTLTYDDDHIPGDYQLHKKDLQDFIQKLRDNYRKDFGITGIRYYACGEYGGNTGRPHFHIVFFNLPLMKEDFNFYYEKNVDLENHVKGESFNGNKYYSFPYIEKMRPYGFHYITDCQDIAVFNYVARYVNKKKQLDKITKEILKDNGIQTEFNLMSTRPGISQLYYLDNMQKLLENNGSIYISGVPYSVDRYFYKLVEKFGSEDFNKLVDEQKRYKKDMLNLLQINKARLYNDDKDLMNQIELKRLKEKTELLKRLY